MSEKILPTYFAHFIMKKKLVQWWKNNISTDLYFPFKYRPDARALRALRIDSFDR